MRLINIDDFAAGKQQGKSAVLKALEKWENEHPMKELVIEDAGKYDIRIECKTNRVIIKRRE